MNQDKNALIFATKWRDEMRRKIKMVYPNISDDIIEEKLKTVLEDTRKFKAVKKDGRNWECIFHEKNMYAGYPHIHFFGSYKLLEELF